MGEEAPFEYTTPVPKKMVEPFDRYVGYGDDAALGGFIPGREGFTPEYMADLNQATADLEGSDYNDVGSADSPFVKRVLDLSQRHKLNPMQVYWNLLNQPNDFNEAWMHRPMSPWEKDFGANNWAFTKGPGGPIGDAASASPIKGWERGPGGKPPALAPRKPPVQDEPPYTADERAQDTEFVKRFVGRYRTAFEHDMNVSRQVSKARARADEARRSGDAELADYIEGLVDVMLKDVDAGRPEPFRHYLPMAAEEFGDERLGRAAAWVGDTAYQGPEPKMPSYNARPDYDPDKRAPQPYTPGKPWVWDDREHPPLTMPSDHADPKFMQALEEAEAFARLERGEEPHSPLTGITPDRLRELIGTAKKSPEEAAYSQGYAASGRPNRNVERDEDRATAKFGDLVDHWHDGWDDYALGHPHRYAYATPGPDPAAPDVDWDPMMQSIQDTGGYTLDGPDSGYMISLPGTEERRPTETVTPHTEGDYHKRHWDKLFNDPDLSQGGWDDKDTFYTDLSRNDADLYRAVGDAVSTDQLGIYDLNRGQTLDTSDDPDTDRDDYNPLLVSPGPIASFHQALREFEAGPLQYQDQFDEAQYPSPPIDLPEKKRRSLEKKFKQPKESLDPDMLDDRIDMDTLIRNALSRYKGATPEQVKGGRDWYATARARAEELARRTGGDFSKAAAIIAAMSPQMEWEGNLNAAAHFLNTYDPTAKQDWRRPNLSPQAFKAWNDLSGGKTPQTPEDFATLAKLNGTGDDEDWAKEMAMPDRWGRASQMASSPKYRYKGAYTGTGLPTLGDNVLRAMNVYDSDDPRELLDYARGGPKIHSFWRNFLGDEDYVTIDKHMLRALDRGFDEDPLLSYGSGKPEVTRKMTPEDKRVNELEGMLGYTRSMKGDEQQQVPTGYNTYATAIRRATQQANAERDPNDQITPAQMQAIIWLQHKDAMDDFRKRKSQEAWETKNPGKSYKPPGPSKYVPGIPTNGPAPDYYQSDEWAQQNPYKGGTPRPHVPEFHGKPMSPDNIPDPALGPAEMSIMPAAPWAKPEWSQGEMPKAAGRWSRRRLERV